ncbi:hypothetical protein [Microbacterium luticocti]|uniref:hypothetical protein n=1 Tax=Microbacterium luticocti TaxID=451764 RepID=UPI0003F56E59|nr:hypothetical protein [Microbacterium luticocti]
MGLLWVCLHSGDVSSAFFRRPVLTASLLLTGCASFQGASDGGSDKGSDTTGASTPTVAPATGEKVTGDGYSFTVPEGWGFPEQGVPGQTAKTFAADLTDDDGFADNVNVLASPAGKLTAEQIESLGVKELKNSGVAKVDVLGRVTIAGSPSPHLSADFSTRGIDYRIDQYYATNDTQTYVVTFSSSRSVSQADRDARAESVLATWAWN